MIFNKVHFLGIGGISQSGLAHWCLSNNIAVSGTDITKTEITSKLEKEGAVIFYAHKKENIDIAKPEVLVYNGAISADNEEVLAAREKGIVIIERSRFLADVAASYKKTIAVAGCHGKTSTVAFLNSILKSLSPSVHDGGIILPGNESFILGKNDVFITEACEFKESFLHLEPDIEIILNIEADHLDYYKNLDNVKLGFYKFALNIKEDGFLILNKDDPNSSHLLKMEESVRYRSKNIHVLTFGLKRNCDCFAKNIKEENGILSFKAYFKNKFVGNIKVKAFGKFYVHNILACICAAKALNVKNEDIIKDISSYVGVKRRMEEVTLNYTKVQGVKDAGDKSRGIKVFHDYAHHPTEIKTVIKACKDSFKKSKIFIIFEPHTFTRTYALEKEFIKCFDKADEVRILPIYAAREIPIEGVTSENLASKIANAKTLASYFDAANYIAEKAQENDAVILILGAGSIVNLTQMI